MSVYVCMCVYVSCVSMPGIEIFDYRTLKVSKRIKQLDIKKELLLTHIL